jgi:hypothetical protein
MRTLRRIKEIIHESVNLTVPRGTLNIPRHEMPQLELKDYPEFFKRLNFHGISVTRKKIPALNLRAAQNEINKEKVLSWVKSLPQGAKEKPIIISGDFFVLDGNHSWLAQLNADTTCHVDCYQVGLHIRELLDALKTLDKITYKTVMESHYIDPQAPYIVYIRK